MTADPETADVRHELRILGTPLTAFDRADSWAAPIVAAELNAGAYGLEDLQLPARAVVLDIGAHVGIVSTWLGLRFPHARIFAFEPCRRNFANLQRTLAANGLANVSAINRAVSADGRPLALLPVAGNSGGTRCMDPGPAPAVAAARSIALAAWLHERRIEKADFLKIDCEGFEYEVLTGPILDRVHRLAGEFHGTGAATLHQLCLDRLGTAKVRIMFHE